MIEVALMIEGQDGLNWDRWQAIARVVEEAGYVGLYRSDHVTNPSGPYKDSLECWTSLTWLRSPEPLTMTGKFFSVREAVLLPRPKRPGGPRLVIGGNGKQFTLALAVRFADEWNAAFRTPEQFEELNDHLNSLLDKAGRPRSAVRRTMMTRLDYADLGKVRAQVTALGEVGVQRVMLQWLDLENTSGIAEMRRALC